MRFNFDQNVAAIETGSVYGFPTSRTQRSFFTPTVATTEFSPAQLDVGLQGLTLFRSLAPPVVVEEALPAESPGAPWGFRAGRKSASHQVVQPQSLLVGPMHALASAATEFQYSQEGVQKARTIRDEFPVWKSGGKT